jgi:hypothetical protein
VVAPAAVKVEDPILQITVGLAELVNVKLDTVSNTVLVFVQLNELVPTTVYIVVAAGVTTTVEPVKAPGLHV